MIQRYLGNKGSLVNEIVDHISQIASPSDLVFDAFSGTMSVTFALKKAGYKVACNDINIFSWIYAQAYLPNNKLPKLHTAFKEIQKSKNAVKQWEQLLSLLPADYDNDFPDGEKRTDIYSHYCEEGELSFFESSRGTKGRRRFFIAENAIIIDRVLNKIRFWFRSGKIDQSIRCLLTTALLEGVEKVSNTQGTYHDFPRDTYDSRALKTIKLRFPDLDSLKGIKSNIFGKERDTLEYIADVPSHKVLYLDPPYNFRQYTSYYFMLNLLSKYSEVDDLDKYFEEVEYVRGQNMGDDFKSPFSSAKLFMPSLRKLIEDANCEYVIMSYFDGRNHWGKFKSSADEEGKKVLSEYFSSDQFEEGSFKVIPIDRLNYQSYGGHNAKVVKEFLFIAKKR